MIKITKQVFCTALCMFSLLCINVSTCTYAEENKAHTEQTEKKMKDNKAVAEPPSGPNVKGEKKEEAVEAKTPASVTGKQIQGTGTVTDYTTSGSKAFYTITDKDSNVFYLIVDLEKTENNVYFLSDVKKSTLDGTSTSKDTETVKPNLSNQKQTETTTENNKSTSEKPKEERNDNSFLYTVLLLAGLGLVGYYFFVYKKKKNKQKNNINEDGETMDDGNYNDNFQEEENKQSKDGK